ncbi:hypothetical protein MASR2M39_05670 [Ignavibacteriales bacterium]
MNRFLQPRYVYTTPTSAPFMENTEETVIINSGTGVVDDEVLATHTDFEGFILLYLN